MAPMLRDVLVPLTLTVSAVFAFALPRVTYRELQPRPIAWSDDVVGSLLKAREENKLVLVYVGAEWDCGSKELEQQTFADPEIRSILQSDFVAVHLDATNDDDPTVRRWLEQLKVVGEPDVIVYSRGGYAELFRWSTFVRPEVVAPKLLAASDDGRHFFRF